MAATNYTPIQLYHSTTASAVPVNTNLVNGELAINIADGKLYYKDSGGTVQVIATKATGTIGGADTQVQYNSSGALAGSSNFTFNGTTATINTLNLTNALGATYGGTAQSSWTTGDLLYASGSNTLAKLGIGLNTYILTSNGSIPGWAAPSAISVNTATNLAGGAAGSVPYQSGAGATTFLSIGTANQVVTSTGSAPQWSSGLSITTLTASDAVTFSATTQNIDLGTSQTSGTFTIGGAAQTGTQTIDQSTKTHTLNLSSGATENAATKTVNIAANGVSGSTTTITVGSANGTSTTWNGAITATAVTENIALGTSQTSGTFTVGGAAQTGTQTFDQSTKTHTLNIGAGATENTLTKTINIGTGGVSGSTTAINIGSTNGTTVTVNGTVNATTVNVTTLDLTNLEVTNIKAKDGTAAMSIADSTGVVTFSANPVLNAGTANGVPYLNASKVLTSGSALTFDATKLSLPTVLAIKGAQNGNTAKIVLTRTDMSWSFNNETDLRFYVQATDTESPANIAHSMSSGGTFVWNNSSASELMRLNTTGLGIGTNNPTTKLHVYGSAPTAFVEGTGTSDAGVQTKTSLANFKFGAGIGSATNCWNVYDIAAGSERMRINSSGNLGIGVTPSAWNSNWRANEVQRAGNALVSNAVNSIGITSNAYLDSVGWKYGANGTANFLAVGNGGGSFAFYTAVSGTASTSTINATALTSAQNGNSYTIAVAGTTDFTLIGAANNNVGTSFTKSGATGAGTGTVTQNIVFTQAMTLDASGRLLVKATSNTGARTKLAVGSGLTTGNAVAYISTEDIDVDGVAISNWTGSATTNRVSLAFDSSGVGNFRIGMPGGVNAFQIYDTTAATERARITSGGDLLVGTTTSYGRLTVQTDGTNGAVGFIRNTNNAFTTALDFIKSRGSTASPTGVQNGDGLFQLRTAPYNGSAYTYLNAMAVEVDGTYTSGQNPPTRIVFYTNAANASAATRAALYSTGQFFTGASGPNNSQSYRLGVYAGSQDVQLLINADNGYNSYINFAAFSGGISYGRDGGTGHFRWNSAVNLGGTQLMTLETGGNLLVGTTSSGGSASNTTRVTGGVFSTFNSTPSIPHNTATTVATLPSGDAIYLASAALQSSGSPTGYNELAVIRVSQSTASVTVLVDAGSLSISVSGLDVQITQGQGATQTCPFALIRLL